MRNLVEDVEGGGFPGGGGRSAAEATDVRHAFARVLLAIQPRSLEQQVEIDARVTPRSAYHLINPGHFEMLLYVLLELALKKGTAGDCVRLRVDEHGEALVIDLEFHSDPGVEPLPPAPTDGGPERAGLGLEISQILVDLMGGSLTLLVDSADGRAAIQVRLPAQRVTTPEERLDGASGYGRRLDAHDGAGHAKREASDDAGLACDVAEAPKDDAGIASDVPGRASDVPEVESHVAGCVRLGDGLEVGNRFRLPCEHRPGRAESQLQRLQRLQL